MHCSLYPRDLSVIHLEAAQYFLKVWSYNKQDCFGHYPSCSVTNANRQTAGYFLSAMRRQASIGAMAKVSTKEEEIIHAK